MSRLRKKLTNDDINELLQCEDEIPSDSESNAGTESEGEAFEPDRNRKIISSSSSSESESDSEVTNIAKKRKILTEEAPNIKWTKTGRPTPPGNFTSSSGPAQNILDLENPTPYDICSEFISDDVIDLIVFQTNLYAQQQDKRYTPTDAQEIRTFIGCNFLMGINKLPSYRDYWSTVPYLHNEYISKLMTVNRFGWILSHLHLNDNNLMPRRDSSNYDRLYKIRPFLDMIQIKFKDNFFPSSTLAIDESMIKFKGRSSLKQYLPNKPIKRGYKVWMLADKSGYCVKFDLYTGKTDKVTTNLGEKVVNYLTAELDGKNYHIYFDNYFTSVKLMENLKERQINACGVVNRTRKYLPPAFSSSKKNKRGDYESFMSNTGVAAVKWADNRNVHILSNFHDPNKLDEVQRKQKDGSRKSYPCPTSIRDYNANMNAVDKFDQLMSSYKLDRRSRKWWHRIFFYFLDAAVINSYILNKQLNNNMPLKEFKGKCAEGFVVRTMVDGNTLTSSKPPIQISNSKPSVSVEVRRTSSSHLPERSTRRRCALCSTKKDEVRTSWACTVCKVPLCMGKKLCFNKYHS